MTMFADFIAESISPVLPPSNPLLKKNWGALAFDRNRYDDLAPSAVWEALFSEHGSSARHKEMIGLLSNTRLAQGYDPLVLPARLESLQHYWSEDAKFLEDHFVFSLSSEWLVRLDQDVTLIAGDCNFLRKVVARLGGFESVWGAMIEEFDPDPTDSVGLRSYLEAITTQLR
jgi:hypothetical protein